MTFTPPPRMLARHHQDFFGGARDPNPKPWTLSAAGWGPVDPIYNLHPGKFTSILLMEEIRNNHLGCIKPNKWWGKVPTSTGCLGFLASTVRRTQRSWRWDGSNDFRDFIWQGSYEVSHLFYPAVTENHPPGLEKKYTVRYPEANQFQNGWKRWFPPISIYNDLVHHPIEIANHLFQLNGHQVPVPYCSLDRKIFVES